MWRNMAICDDFHIGGGVMNNCMDNNLGNSNNEHLLKLLTIEGKNKQDDFVSSERWKDTYITKLMNLSNNALDKSINSRKSRNVEEESSEFLDFLQKHSNQEIIDSSLNYLMEINALEKKDTIKLDITSNSFPNNFRENFQNIPIPQDTMFIKGTEHQNTSSSKWIWFEWRAPICGWTCRPVNAWLGGDFWTAAIHCAVIGHVSNTNTWMDFTCY